LEEGIEKAIYWYRGNLNGITLPEEKNYGKHAW
jgi:hypothetical protein